MASRQYKRPSLGLQILKSSVTFHHPKEHVRVGFKKTAIMRGVERNVDHLYIFASGMVGNVVCVVYDGGSFGGFTGSVA